MDRAEYDKMLETKFLQQSEKGITHVLINGPLGFEAQVPKGRLYVEFDIPTNVSIVRGGGDGWGIFYSS